VSVRLDRVIAAAALLAVSACASVATQGDAAGTYGLAEERTDPGAAAPKAFLLEKDGRTIAVFGTTHLVPETLRWLSPETAAQLARADLILTETSISRPDEVTLSEGEQNDMAARMVLPPGETFWGRAGRNADAIRQALATRGLSAGLYTPLRPWVVCRDLQIPTGAPTIASDQDRAMIKEMVKRFGLPDPIPPDLKIELFGIANGIEVMFLESEYDRALNFSRLSDADGLECAARTAERGRKPSQNKSVADVYAQMLDLWLSGDAEATRRWMENDQRTINTAWANLFLQERENLWLSRIANYCDAGRRNCFIAVGMAHLGGSDGLLKGLERLGYRPAQPQG
jgi:uncharacterized protein YbaP (TraB family)